MEREKKFWHICTAGLEKELIFKTEADYIFGMNCIPLSIADRAVSVKTFCLMDNHVHFIVHGAAEECGSFIKGYRRRLFTLADMSRAEICMKEINDTEYLMRAICYVLRNPTAAGLAVLPSHYRWGSGPLYFNGGNIPVKPLSQISANAGRSACSAPDNSCLDNTPSQRTDSSVRNATRISGSSRTYSGHRSGCSISSHAMTAWKWNSPPASFTRPATPTASWQAQSRISVSKYSGNSPRTTSASMKDTGWPIFSANVSA